VFERTGKEPRPACRAGSSSEWDTFFKLISTSVAIPFATLLFSLLVNCIYFETCSGVHSIQPHCVNFFAQPAVEAFFLVHASESSQSQHQSQATEQETRESQLAHIHEQQPVSPGQPLGKTRLDFSNYI